MTEKFADLLRAVFLIFYIFGLITWVLRSENKAIFKMKKIVNLFLFSVLCSLILVVWYNWPFIIDQENPNWDKKGLGDKYGGLNTLFTGLAFAGLVFTILLQKIQIKDAEEEQTRQRFENIFFQLLNSFNQMIDSVELKFPIGNGEKSRAAFVRMCDNLLNQYIFSDIHKDEIDPEERIKKKYDVFYSLHQNELGHYYRTLFHIFKFIHLSKIEDKKFYANLVRAQLSSQQVLLLFYNGFSDEGNGFKEYVETYALLKHRPNYGIPKPLKGEKSLLSHYKESAYGNPKKKAV
jgi:Putative phage abortive infection protein